MKKVLKHESGMVKEVKIGFSWTTFFFGLFVPLIRGDLKWALIMLGIAFLAGVPTMGIGSIVSNIIFAFIYNKLYIRELLEKGYRPQNEEDYVAISSYTNS
ncbi:MAG TPA: hypothetical protein VK071_11200 [Tissierellales bacterium]|nr:hypothetical protein [Tissierellales bacterium]